MNRIKAIASLVDNDALVVDIGTDHAYLPIYLYENDITKNIVASDISRQKRWIFPFPADRLTQGWSRTLLQAYRYVLPQPPVSCV